MNEDLLIGLGNPDYFTPPWEQLLEKEQDEPVFILTPF
jgi:hypothetical protein